MIECFCTHCCWESKPARQKVPSTAPTRPSSEHAHPSIEAYPHYTSSIGPASSLASRDYGADRWYSRLGQLSKRITDSAANSCGFSKARVSFAFDYMFKVPGLSRPAAGQGQLKLD